MNDHPVGFSDGVDNGLTGDPVGQQEDQHDHDVQHQLLHLAVENKPEYRRFTIRNSWTF